MRTAPLIATLGLALALPGAAFANGFGSGEYQLLNHPDGAIAAPYYGLRLDGLTGDKSEEVTFDFEHQASDMRASFDANTGLLTISGTAFGGEDTGSAYNPNWSGLWDIQMTYVLEDKGSYWQTSASPYHTGTVVSRDGLGSYNLVDKNNMASNPWSFRIAQGHRGHAGWSGWGWVNHDVFPDHVNSSDWLFTIKPVPEPGTWALILLGGLALVGGARRR